MKHSPRSLAVRFLIDLFRDQANLDSLSQSPGFLELEERDRRLVTELVYGVLRNRTLLDYYLAKLSRTALGKLDEAVLWILRVALYQVEFMRVPDHAAVHEAVATCRRLRKRSASGFVNAILRRFLREELSPPEGESAEALAIRFSHPEWLVKRFLHRYGSRRTIDLLDRNNEPPPPVHWVNVFKTDLPSLCKELEDDEISYEVDSSLPNCLVIHSPSFSEHPAYREGRCFRMDAGSQEVVYLGQFRDCRTLGDFCCAPGGKSFLMASKMVPGSRLFCCDVSLSRLKETANRVQLHEVPNLDLIHADLRVGPPFRCEFDFILLDVPCSGIGTVRSNPDIRWKMRENDLNRLHTLQLSVLTHGFSALRPGGELTYATCSTEPEENESVIEEFLAREEKAREIGEYHRNFPDLQRGDCFFAARIRHV
ncbi:MAG: transcription antitermination factor NusB [Acidobacteriota bacterium]